MPNPSELARADAEKTVRLEPATKFDIAIQFGPHQAKLIVDIEVISGSDAEAVTNYLAGHMLPHIEEMLKAEERTHGRS